ncbi:cytochrome-c peroxidase [Sulfurimonas sp. MAG313]|nr:cytochrome-c peroxidase [Sulfurimonas sp. MAG313]MDF1880730.1 cytochrome-c peroxidase [Sulfurimonas sp. MAG313]
MLKIILFFYLFNCFLFSNEPITPIPQHVQVNQDKANLGKKLFFDTRLSADNTISCHSCHKIQEGGDDNLQFSFGIYGQEGNINAPTVLNARYNFRQFWDGREKNLKDQVASPIENPIEMGSNFPELIKKLNKTEYLELFKKTYKDAITKENISDAIAQYEKTLITPNAPFDQYLRGNKDAITSEQKEGYALFKSKGCISCHHGINVGGNLYNKFGVVHDTESTSLGRYNVTKKERDKYYFKVPSLRNVTRTAPYFHDGRTKKLKKAIKFMADVQLGRAISDKEINSIAAFLHSLEGDLPQGKE